MKITIDYKTLKKANNIVCMDILTSMFDDPNCSHNTKLDIAEDCILAFEKNGIVLPKLNPEQIEEVKQSVTDSYDYANNTAAYIFGYFHEQGLINYEEY